MPGFEPGFVGLEPTALAGLNYIPLNLNRNYYLYKLSYNNMIVNVKVIPNAKKEEIIKEKDRLKVKVLAIDNKANKALINLLSKYYNIKKNQIKILKGLKSREKVIEIT